MIYESYDLLLADRCGTNACVRSHRIDSQLCANHIGSGADLVEVEAWRGCWMLPCETKWKPF